MIHIGIDPGINGAVALVRVRGIGRVFDTPTISVKGSSKKEYNAPSMANLMREISTIVRTDTSVYIEKVSAMPGQGVTSMFNFGKGYGIWLGILAAAGIPYTLVTPQRWRKEMMKGMAKDQVKARAIQLFPHLGSSLARVKDEDRAVALLLAELSRREENAI